MPRKSKSFKKRILLCFSVVTLLSFVIFFILLFWINIEAYKSVRDSSNSVKNLIVKDSQDLLLSLNEELVYQKAKDVAMQIELFLKSHPGLTRSQLINNAEFRKISSQPVGKTGYTVVYENKTGVTLFHPNPKLVNYNTANLKEQLPEWWAIFSKGMSHKEARGYYKWREANGKMTQKYMVTVPVKGYTYNVAVTTYLEEFTYSQKLIADKAIETIEKMYLAFKKSYKSYLTVLGVCFVAFLSLIFVVTVKIADLFSKPVLKIKDITKSISDGNFEVPSSSRKEYDEIETIYSSIHHMVDKFKDYQCKLTQSAHLAAIGQTTSMLAHDIRRPFSNMKMFLAQLPAKKNDDAFIRQSINDLDASLAQVDDMLDQTLHLGRKIELKCGAYLPEMLIESCLKETFKKGTVPLQKGDSPLFDVKLEYELKHSRHYFVDIKEVSRVFNNIVFNAVEAMNGKGIIKFAVSDEVSDGKMFIKTSISNNGPTISVDIIDKLFDPFMTHGKEKGTGLGLAICKKIVEEHGGWIKAESNETNGTQFIFALPAVEGEKGTVPLSERGLSPFSLPAHSDMISSNVCHPRESGDLLRSLDSPATLPAGRRLRGNDKLRGDDRHYKEKGTVPIPKGDCPLHQIVIIDDEDLPILHAKKMIEDCKFKKDNYEIICFSSGEEALPFIEKNKDVKLVLVDYNLGDGRKNGVEIIKEIKKVSPSTKILMASNFCPPEERFAALQAGAHSFAPKPIAKGDIVSIFQNSDIS